MNLYGVLIVFLATILYVLRFSSIKSLENFSITKPQINFIYRLFSLPILLLVLVVFKGANIELKPQFWIYFLLALVVNLIYGLFQVHVFHKNKFSSVTTLEPLAIIFSALLGYFLLSEAFPKTFVVSLALIVLAFFILVLTEKDYKVSRKSLIMVVVYNIFNALIYYVNKRAINESDSFTFAFMVSLGLCVSNYILTFVYSRKALFVPPKGSLPLLLTTGLLTGIGFALVSYGYVLLPLSGVSAILALEPFVSLVVSKYKYKEESLLPKLFASVIAFAGVLIMVLVK